ncbi:hypothetical protein VTJ04DRAFT_8763 [Mycothermus thermophilus]|uniref:uncharacterized protein n=1 Tax=Humicola insolens TaxID=85995 RepID=UPI003744A829
MTKPTPAAARLRRTFHYPSSDDDDNSDRSTPEFLDEQEQESLIATLAAQNAARNESHRRLLLALPALSTVPFLLRLVLPPSSSSSSPLLLLPLLGLSSLFATGWLLLHLPPEKTGLAWLDDRRSVSQQQQRQRQGGGGRGGRSGLSSLRSLRLGLPRRSGHGGSHAEGILDNPTTPSTDSPLAQHLPVLNIALAALCLLTGLLENVKSAGPTNPGGRGGVSPLLLGALPGIVYAVVVAAKVVMAGVDPEGELKGLRYRYKGA